MKCSEVDELLSAYADGEVNGCKVTDLKAHLDECIICSQHLEVLHMLQDRLRCTTSIETAGIDVSNAVMSSLPVQKRTYLPRLAWGMASILIVAVVIWLSDPGIKQRNILNPPIIVKLPIKHYPKPNRLATITLPDKALSARKYKFSDLKKLSRNTHKTGYHKNKSGISEPIAIHTAQQTPAPDAEPYIPIRVAVKSRVINGVTVTTFEVTSGSLIVLGAKPKDIEIHCDDKARLVERPPLKVEQDNSPIDLGIFGG